MFARTDRLFLRPGWPEDAAALVAAIGDRTIVEKLARAPWPYRQADAEAFLATQHPILPNFLIFSRTRGAPRLIGGIGLAEEPHGVELGYWIAQPFWGLGFATEAANAVLHIADHGLRLPRLIASHRIDNPASPHVLHKLGFRSTQHVTPRFCQARNSFQPCITYWRDAGDRMRGPKDCDPQNRAIAA